MGLPLIFQAVPEDSRLYAALKSDRRIGTLFAQLFNCGGGPYSWAALSDLDEHLDWMAEHEPELASRPDLDRALADLLAALEEARADHPGLERRYVYLDKTQWEIEERLTGFLQSQGMEDATEFVQVLLFGAAPLTLPGVRGTMGNDLAVVPPATVEEAARILQEVAPGALFDGEDEDDLWQDYLNVRELYLAAAERGEAIVVGA